MADANGDGSKSPNPDTDGGVERVRSALEGLYTVEREIGRGGMAVVYLARDCKHGRRVALKVLSPELAHSVSAHRFLSEIRTTARLTHPHILTLHDSGEAEGLLFYVMPYITGESLADRLQRSNKLPLNQALRITREVAEALAFAHSQGIVHRDVKPGNILLSSNGHAYVSDFGLARALYGVQHPQLTGSGLVVGSPLYMSPEQIQGAGTADSRSDIYSLGCVLYEMLSGHPPLAGASMQETLMQHLTEAPPPLRLSRPDVPPSIERAVLRALAKAPGERFTSAADFARALHTGGKYRTQDTATLPETAWLKTGVQKLGRIPRLTYAVAGLALTALVTGSMLLASRSDQFPASSAITIAVLPVDVGDNSGNGAPAPAALQQVLSHSLESIPGLRAISGAPILESGRRWRSYSISSLVSGAAALGARYVALAEVLPESDPRVSLQIFDLDSGERVMQRTGGGEAEPLIAGLQRLALQAVREIAYRENVDLGPDGRFLAATNSPEALGEMREARELFSSGQHEAAVVGFRRAIAADSSFAPAYFYLSAAQTGPPRWDYAAAFESIETGLRHRSSIPAEWEGLLQAQRYYLMRDGAAAVSAFYQLTSANPDFAEAWLGLGESYFHLGGHLGHGPESALPAFQRLIEADPSFAPHLVFGHLVDAALWADDVVTARRYLSEIPPGSDRIAREAVLALRSGNETVREETLAELHRADALVLAQVVHLTATRPDLLVRVAEAYTGALRPASEQIIGGRFRFAALASLGRWEEAMEEWRMRVHPQEFDPWMIHAYLAGFPSDTIADRMFAAARRVVDGPEPIDFADPVARAAEAYRALVHRALLDGDAADVGWLLDRLREARTVPVDPEPRGLRLSLEARQALLSSDTTAAIRLLRDALTRGPWALETYYQPLRDAAPQRLMLARLSLRYGDRDGARQWAGSFGNTLAVGDVVFLPAATELLEQLPADQH